MIIKRYFIGSLVFLITLFTNNISAQTMTLATDDVSCIVGRGRIIVNVTSGTSPYSYYLFDGDPFAGGNLLDSEVGTGDPTHIFADWPAAVYWVGLTSTEGSIAQPINLSTVQDKALSSPTITVVQGPTCINSHDGILSASATGGNPPYTYNWAPGGQITQTITGVGQGTYAVTVNDSYNCGPTNQATLFFYQGIHDSIPDSLSAGSINGTQSICSGGNPGLLDEVIPPSGGRGGYTYSWEYQSNCSGPWTPIAGATDPYYDPPGGLTETRCYRRVVTNICGIVTSNTVTVTVNPLPTPTISGPTPVCEGSTGNTYTTEAGMSNYTWTVSAGGTITAGGGINNNSVTVTWNTPGAQSVSVNYQNGFGCWATSPTVYPVTVNPAPTPSLNGPTPVCEGSSGNTYTTDAGMSNYIWVVSAGGTITDGGGINDDYVEVTWNAPGAQSVSVNYDDANGCSALTPAILAVTVNPLPVPSLNGSISVCESSAGNTYTTDAGMSNYVWVVSAGGTITNGGGVNDDYVEVTWDTPGAQSVSVSYTDANGCTAAAPTVLPVTVNPLPVPTLNGPTSVCLNSTHTYTTEGGMSNYIWIISAGGIITDGGGVNDGYVEITWTVVGPQSVAVNYTDANGCTAAAPTVLNITVNPLPVPSLTGDNDVCLNDIETYNTDAGMSNYVWMVSAGGTITAGGGINDDFVTIQWTAAGARTVSVNYDDPNGCSAVTPTVLPVTVNPLPVPSLTGDNDVCLNDIETYNTDAGMSNYVWAVSAGGTVTAGGGAGDDFVTVQWTA
ncbi:MAG: hypothetical protein JXB24_14840, partial [Bacteroidales bacterium]|nr:hypothetical protein [Bacteroidales bacterium]